MPPSLNLTEEERVRLGRQDGKRRTAELTVQSQRRVVQLTERKLEAILRRSPLPHSVAGKIAKGMASKLGKQRAGLKRAEAAMAKLIINNA